MSFILVRKKMFLKIPRMECGEHRGSVVWVLVTMCFRGWSIVNTRCIKGWSVGNTVCQSANCRTSITKTKKAAQCSLLKGSAESVLYKTAVYCRVLQRSAEI